MAKKAGKILGVMVLVMGLSVLGLAQTKTLTILHTNDTHSALLPLGHPSWPGPFGWLMGSFGRGGRGRASLVRESGGMARMAALIKRVRMREKNVLALHAGDVFVGSFEFNKYLGYPELKIMENLYDAMSLGNHEFDLSMDVLAGVVSGALGDAGPVTLPILCANIDFEESPTVPYPRHPLADLIKKSIIKEIDGISIGIFGLVNESPVNYTKDVIKRFSKDVLTVAGDQAKDLRDAGCAIVICLSHLGTEGDRDLADSDADIDIIVGGHSHDLFDNAVVRNGKIVVQVDSHGRHLGELAVDYEPGKGVTLRHWTAWPVDSRIRPDPRVQAQMNRLRDGVVQDPRFGPVYSRIVALVGRDIVKEWPETGPYRDTPLGNLVSDAMIKAVTGAGFAVDCALDALGYISFGIPAGKVVGNDVMRAVPYGYDEPSGLGFKLVVVPMPGQLILGGLGYAVAQKTLDLCIQPSGLTYAYNSALGQLDPMSVKINDEVVALSPRPFFNVVMTDAVFGYLEDLVSSMGITLVKIDTGIFEYTAVRDYMRSLRFVTYESTGRVIDTAAPSAAKLK